LRVEMSRREQDIAFHAWVKGFTVGLVAATAGFLLAQFSGWR
jgi:hypothetical protein